MILLAAGVVAATQHAGAGEVAEFNRRRALDMMESLDAPSRALAFRACRQLGEAGKHLYRELLEAAVDFHERTIEGSIGLAAEEADRFSGTLSKLRQQRDFALQFTLTNINKEGPALADLQRAHGDAGLWFREAQAQHGRAMASMGAISESASALDEIRREQGYCSGRAAVISQLSFQRVLSKHSSYASNLHDRVAELSAFRSQEQDYQAAMAHNRAQTWATPEMRVFADLLNERRHTLGLPLLHLDRCLSSACTQHAREMDELGYFAHLSPVSENSTPERRAANARYPGTFVGENIFCHARPRGARAAFDAWWQSDGHRFVLFDPKPDQLGLSDQPGAHWTMMTGAAPLHTAVESAQVE